MLSAATFLGYLVNKFHANIYKLQMDASLKVVKKITTQRDLVESEKGLSSTLFPGPIYQ